MMSAGVKPHSGVASRLTVLRAWPTDGLRAFSGLSAGTERRPNSEEKDGRQAGAVAQTKSQEKKEGRLSQSLTCAEGPRQALCQEGGPAIP
jgi:hypothetical protein